ncbi:MAG TPA: PIG-L family deacetylase [Blastocatellia bacterium]|nr:PIG-L family deacetylase [Blastocatellia bacterium]
MGQLIALCIGFFRLVAGNEGPNINAIRYITNATPAQHHVFVVAHEDDWQLFMGDIVARQIRAGDSVLLVYLTAGDDGRDSLYWRTRELAALHSTRVAIGRGASDSAAVRCSTTTVLNHAIHQCVVANTKSYFLRLPDGKRNGMGFASHDYQSLRKLRGKKIPVANAIDGSAAYNGWGDLTNTISNLIGPNSSDRDVVVHANDPSIAANPHDHFDHRMTGLLVEDLRRTQRWKTQYYVGYALATRAANRSTDEARVKTAIFLAYESEMKRVNPKWSAYDEHPEFYSECMLRTYARKARSSNRR